ncbi:hypothetical protein AK830_g9423 [Neonectria ditissima]|uniref:Zn(2)-C6 fungal-type domain-containing protein n=1 Tax=Neonectria ditissima TaxID=78410 RepID=A0A0P7B9I9_9HYPO|nr:hypothetical protein AK830_g9423 [Neonectria ditissima]
MNSSGEEFSSPFQSSPAPLRAGPAGSRATVRAPLACTSCRTRHVKCDSELPSCGRCQQEGSTCFYPKSRRGIKEQAKRDMIKEEFTLTESPDATPSPNFSIPTKATKPLPGGWVANSRSQKPQSLNYMFDLYYAYFHDSHPWLPPKQIMFRLVEGRPDDFEFTMAMIVYIGSIYSNTVDTAQLRQRAFDIAAGPLFGTVWAVQALLCLSIAAYGEEYVHICGYFFEKSLDMALELGLHKKSFADAEDSPVLAESYRRTYWALYLHGSLRAVREHLGHFQLYCTHATTDLPCEEWEYQAGDIPIPMSIKEFNQKMSSRSHSSWAYLVDLIRISGEYVVPLLNAGIGAEAESVDSADYRIASWLSQLPHWKKELVDPNGAVDMVLYHAIGIAYG